MESTVAKPELQVQAMESTLVEPAVVAKNDWKQNPYPSTLTTPYFCRWTSCFWAEKPLLPRTLPAVIAFVNVQLLLVAMGAIGLTAWASGSDCRGSGVASSYATALVFTVVPHNSLVTFLFGVPFERCLEFHKVFAVGALASSTVHMTWCSTDLSGWGMLAAMILGTVLSTNYVRRKFFEVFYKFHWVMFLLVIGLAPLHYRCHIYIYPGVLIWFLDVLYRYFYLAMHRYPKDAIVFALPADVVRLEFPKGKFGYRPGQYVFICIPALAYFQWHPMSISSSPHQESVSIHIRALGDWTRKLYDMAKAGGAQGVKIHMLFEGPYGEPMIDLDNEKYKSVLLISGGIGITPMQSICNNLIYQEKNGRKLNKLWFVWSAADRYIIDAMWDGVKRLPVNDDPARLPLSFQPDDVGIHLLPAAPP
ncbi:hypothetical protein CYMTET_18770 [Cymbomonas tetramitiformis]|uniref:FAD-binding FR-type domain-containing protein n=1 Tax=Cymbomonas tetramitiformis TaxID=36881 RepID=A0AAE0G816_9CHLO|nr:hypothetical protein CYMTET_18770 [Cymbomonas tetramitiformis]